MSVHPPDALDLARKWRAEADALDGVAPKQLTMGAVWKCRTEAAARRQYADELEQHMQGVTP